jgi:hypothetical protein
VTPYYAIMESRHRWLILAGLSFGSALVGAIMMLAWNWPHPFIQAWFYLGAALTVTFLIQAARTWWSAAESYLQTSSSPKIPERARLSPEPAEAAGVTAEEDG